MNIQHSNGQQDHQGQIESIIQAETALAEAHLQLDLDRIDQLLHPDYVIIQAGGRTESKQQVMDSYRSGERYWETARSDELDIRIFGDSAIVIGRWTASGHHGEACFDYSARFLSIWVRQHGRWRNVAAQSTEIKP